MNQPFDIVGMGYIAVDDLLGVAHFPPPDAKTPVTRRDRQCGGLTATALVAAARLGSRCAYAGVMGDDELSHFARQVLEREGVDLSLLVHDAKCRPVHSVIVVAADGTRNIFYDRSAARSPEAAELPADLIARTRVLFVDQLICSGTLAAARQARQAGVPVVADLEHPNAAGFAKLLPLVDHLIIPQECARALTGCSAELEAARALAAGHPGQNVVVTSGAAGCVWVAAQSGGGGGSSAAAGGFRAAVSGDAPEGHVPAFVVPVVDTTGCGDVFHGAYAHALARGATMVERVRFAAATAALKATKPGGQAGIPDLATVLAFLKERGVPARGLGIS